MPEGLSYGLNIPLGNITMQSLRPYDTQSSKGFITTLALAYIPADMFDALDLARKTPTSTFKNNPNPPINQMIGLLDASIPLLASPEDDAGTITSGSGSGSSGNDSGNSGSGTNNSDGDPIGGDSSTKPVSSKAIGVAGGVCAGAAVYGAAMFLVARRYRKRRSRHSRSSSMTRSTSPGNSPGSAAIMGTGAAVMHGAARNPYADNRGSRGSGKASARTQNISAPIVAENSLGWN
jgi:hypothetical protein